MTDWLFSVLLSSAVLGCMAYMTVWGMHNFDITVNSIMVWADQQETFLQKMVSCPMCLTVQASMALSAFHCLAFGRGLWTWVLLSLGSSLVGLFLLRKLDILGEKDER